MRLKQFTSTRNLSEIIGCSSRTILRAFNKLYPEGYVNKPHINNSSYQFSRKEANKILNYFHGR